MRRPTIMKTTATKPWRSLQLAVLILAAFSAAAYSSNEKQKPKLYRDFNAIGHTTFTAVLDTKAANWRSRAFAAPVRQPSAMDWEAGSGKISSSPFSSPSKMPRAADSVEAFGMSKPRFISVSMGPRKTP